MRITLNILPDDHKKRIRQKELFSRVLSYVIGIFFLTLFFVMILFSILFGIQSREFPLFTDETIDEKKLQSLIEYDEILFQKNKDMELIEKLLQNEKKYTKTLSLFSDLNLEGITFSSLNIAENTKVNSKGFSKTRDKILELQEKLRQDECFLSVEVPIEDLVKKEDVDFSLSFTLNDACLL
ncbi:MAG: hypothetical protein IPN70_03910 [Candidatus Moraniibacteriota bacterium]|nr:MAG: hypothetical protein IPN70_03910 [Candidatus Moranbacteria bacterium]